MNYEIYILIAFIIVPLGILFAYYKDYKQNKTEFKASIKTLGKGIFKGLYNYMKTAICVDYFNLIITEIDTHNTRSLTAHKSIGFKKLHDYSIKNKDWRIVTLKP